MLCFLLFILSVHTVLHKANSYFDAYTGSCVFWVVNTAETVFVSNFSLKIRFLFL